MSNYNITLVFISNYISSHDQKWIAIEGFLKVSYIVDAWYNTHGRSYLKRTFHFKMKGRLCYCMISSIALPIKTVCSAVLSPTDTGNNWNTIQLFINYIPIWRNVFVRNPSKNIDSLMLTKANNSDTDETCRTYAWY